MVIAYRIISLDRQRGQAALWLLVTLAACCAILALVYNVGQVSNEKEKTINAADAAALSGALVEARTLNFVAYTNRAMIANEVTVAQLVSAESWIAYDATMANYLDEYLQPLAFIPYVGEVVVEALDYYSDIMQQVQSGANQAISSAIPLLDDEMSALSAARKLALIVAPASADNVASAIAGANATTLQGRYDEQPELNPVFRGAFLVANIGTWSKFTDDGSDRTYAAQVIQNARDQFSTDRGEGPMLDGLNQALKYGLLLGSFGMAYVGVEKTSTQTQLQGFDHWKAQDTLDVFTSVKHLCGGLFNLHFCEDDSYTGAPLAYGRADADSDGSIGDSSGRDLCHPRYAPGGVTTNCRLAGSNGNGLTFNGIPNIVDLAQPGSASNNPTLTFVAGAQKKGDAALTTQRLGSPGMDTTPLDGPLGSPNLQDNLQNTDHLTAMSAAVVFFSRPSGDATDPTASALFRSDHRHEYASLYSPYWQARLSPVTMEFKTMLYAFVGLNPALALATP